VKARISPISDSNVDQGTDRYAEARVVFEKVPFAVVVAVFVAFGLISSWIFAL
jgi:hypothetical protein